MAGPQTTSVTLAVALLVIACGGDNSDSDDDDDASAMGGAGTGSGGAGGVGGEGGTEAAGPPQPSFDCLEDEASKTCIAVRGMFDGEEIDRHCAVPQMGNLLNYNPNAWIADCAESGDREDGWWYRINTPARMSGSFVIPINPDSTSGASVAVAFELRGGEFYSSHFEEGQLSGRIWADATSGHTTISGTFSATWADPEEDYCNPGVAVVECLPVDVVGNYFVEHFLEFE